MLTHKQLLDLRSLDESQQQTTSRGSGGGEDENVRRIRELIAERTNYEEALWVGYILKHLTLREFLTLLTA